MDRKIRRSEKLLKGLMIGLAVFFLMQAIAFATSFMLPCFLMIICCFWYSHASRREYEYTFEDETIKIDRVSDRGRQRLHEIPFAQIILLCKPDAPEAMPYKKGGTVTVRKYDYTSYQEDVPYYTLIAKEDQETYKFLLDLTPEAIAMIRRHNRDAVKIC